MEKLPETNERHPLLLRYIQHTTIRVSVVLRDLVSPKCPPCGILVLTGNPNREGSPIYSLRQKLCVDNKLPPLPPIPQENKTQLSILNWNQIQVQNPDSEGPDTVPMWDVLYWFKQETGQNIKLAFYEMKNVLLMIDRYANPGSTVSFPLIGSESTTMAERVSCLFSILHDLNGLKNITKILVYTYRVETLNQINIRWFSAGFRPVFDFIFNDHLLDQLKTLKPSHGVIQSYLSIICTNLTYAQQLTSQLEAKNQLDFGTIVVGAIQSLGMNIRLCLEEFVRHCYKKVTGKKNIKPGQNVAAMIRAIDATGQWRELLRIVDRLRSQCNILQHSGCLWFVGEVEIDVVVRNYIIFLRDSDPILKKDKKSPKK